eukprot:Skav225166  [mRNA]  locus=scaffold1095:86807:87571:+ [translate_table: standard]
MEHRLCFQQLVNIIDILSKQDGSLALLPQLRLAVSTHNDLFCKLYPQCAKPKFHWLFHLPENLAQFKVNMNCFCPERKHRAVKAVASHVCNYNLMGHVAMRIGWDTLQAFDKADSNMCKPIYLDGPIRHINEGAEMLSFWSDEIVCVRTARKLATPTGQVCLGDMVLAVQRRQLFVPQAFVEVTLMSGKRTFMVQAECHKHEQGASFAKAAQQALLTWEPEFIPVPYIVRSSGSLHACLHRLDLLAMSKNLAPN